MIGRFIGAYRFLSNFYYTPVVYGGVEYSTAEHAYQAAKTNEADWKQSIRNATTAGDAKRLGRSAPVRHEWEDEKLSVMRDILESKFSNPTLAGALKETADEELVEGNTWGDTFWGVCNGTGENHLGKLLMEIRGRL